jgi:hypothetical protein
MRFFGRLRFGKSGSVIAERGKLHQSGPILGRFLVAIFAGTRHLEPPSDRIGTRRQFFDLFGNGGDFARRLVQESPRLNLDVAICAGEIRVDQEPVFIGDDFCLLVGFRKQKFRDFQRRFSPRFGICSRILDNAKLVKDRKLPADTRMAVAPNCFPPKEYSSPIIFRRALRKAALASVASRHTIYERASRLTLSAG